VDPYNARDIDDALSVECCLNGSFKIGVHIADVSYFVEEDSPIDQDAQRRTTSVYLVHKVFHMLPELLCQQLCSLTANNERLTFSVFFHMSEEGELLRDKPV